MTTILIVAAIVVALFLFYWLIFLKSGNESELEKQINEDNLEEDMWR